MLRTLVLSLAVTCLGCASTTIPVEQHGGMRDVLRMGQTQPRISFEEIQKRPNAIAVGALAGLEGEVTVFDGEIFMATTADGASATTRRDPQGEVSVTLLTLAYVSSWVEQPLEAASSLEDAILLAARSHRIDTSKPFPFTIVGVAESYEIHVINGYCPVATPSLPPEDQPWRQKGERVPLRLVGFYATGQEGVMTHHGSNTHMHAIIGSGEGVITGHLDSVVLAPGSKISLARGR